MQTCTHALHQQISLNKTPQHFIVPMFRTQSSGISESENKNLVFKKKIPDDKL